MGGWAPFPRLQKWLTDACPSLKASENQMHSSVICLCQSSHLFCVFAFEDRHFLRKTTVSWNWRELAECFCTKFLKFSSSSVSWRHYVGRIWVFLFRFLLPAVKVKMNSVWTAHVPLQFSESVCGSVYVSELCELYGSSTKFHPAGWRILFFSMQVEFQRLEFWQWFDHIFPGGLQQKKNNP